MLSHSCDAPSRHALLPTILEQQPLDDPYWVTDHYYALDGGAVEAVLVPAAEELWALCQDFVERAVAEEAILASLGIPRPAWDAVRASWARRDPLLFSRFDLSFDGRSQPKLHECNIDVVGMVHETAIFQRRWLDHQKARGRLDPAVPQLARLEEATAGILLRAMGGGAAVQLAILGDDPDDALWQDAIHTILRGIGIAGQVTRYDTADAFQDAIAGAADAPGMRIIKSFRWDHLVGEGARATGIGAPAQRITSPLWSLILSSKGSLAWLWHFNRGHPNLLPAYFDPRHLADADGFASKPLFSIQGRSVALFDSRAPRWKAAADRMEVPRDRVFQKLHYLPRIRSDGRRAPWVSTGAWIVAGKAVAIGMTECDSPVMTDAAMRFVPHILA